MICIPHIKKNPYKGRIEVFKIAIFRAIAAILMLSTHAWDGTHPH